MMSTNEWRAQTKFSAIVVFFISIANKIQLNAQFNQFVMWCDVSCKWIFN